MSSLNTFMPRTNLDVQTWRRFKLRFIAAMNNDQSGSLHMVWSRI